MVPRFKATVQRPLPGDDVVPSHELEHFQAISIASSTINDSNFRTIAISRALSHGGRGHTLMASTWNTSDTIAHLLSFYRSGSPTPDDPASRAETRRFYTFGNGMNAHADLLHGGVIATVLDSTMGNAAGMALREYLGDEHTSIFTVQLNVKYEKPVKTPGTIMARSWVKKVEDGGRKVWVEGSIQGGVNGEISHAKAEGLWLRAKVEKL